MKLPGFKRLYKTDFPTDEQDLVEKLSFSLNDAIQALFDALNRKLTFKDNMQSTIKTLTVSVDSSGVPTTKTGFTLDQTGTILGMIVVRAQNLDNTSAFVTAAVQIDAFDQQDQTIFINHITGLQAKTNYRLNIITIT